MARHCLGCDLKFVKLQPEPHKEPNCHLRTLTDRGYLQHDDYPTTAHTAGKETVDLAAGQDPVLVAATFSHGRGVDAVIITAATRSHEPVHQAAQMCRQRGRIVLVGVVGLELSRADFFEKELRFQVSCSYGPGRYDPRYEEQGLDYPIGFVRWTEQRNFEAVLDLLADGRLDVAPLVSHRFPLAEAERAYAVVAGAEPSLGIILEYPGGDEARLRARTVELGGAGARGPVAPAAGSAPATVTAAVSALTATVPSVSFIGAGNYATGVLIPAFKAARTNCGPSSPACHLPRLVPGRPDALDTLCPAWGCG